MNKLEVVPKEPKVADVVLIPHCSAVSVVLDGAHAHSPVTAQLPAVKLTEVIFVGVPVVRFPVVVGPAEGCSPILPAAGLSLVVVPLMPIVLVGVINPVALIVVAATGSGVADPYPVVGGDANALATQVKPVPLVY